MDAEGVCHTANVERKLRTPTLKSAPRGESETPSNTPSIKKRMAALMQEHGARKAARRLWRIGEGRRRWR